MWLAAWNLRSGRAKVIPASYRPSDSRPDQAVFLFCSENWPFPLCSVGFKPKARQSSPRMHAGVVALLPLIICSGTLPPPGCELQVQPRSHLLGAESPLFVPVSGRSTFVGVVSVPIQDLLNAFLFRRKAQRLLALACWPKLVGAGRWPHPLDYPPGLVWSREGRRRHGVLQTKSLSLSAVNEAWKILEEPVFSA